MAITAKVVAEGDEIKTSDHNALVTDVKALDAKPSKGDKGDPGKDGAAGIGVKAIALTVDADGKVTGGTMTKTDNSTAAITVTAE